MFVNINYIFLLMCEFFINLIIRNISVSAQYLPSSQFRAAQHSEAGTLERRCLSTSRVVFNVIVYVQWWSRHPLRGKGPGGGGGECCVADLTGAKCKNIEQPI